MKLNIANPITGLQRTIEIDDEKRLLPFFGKHMGAEVAADTLGDEFKGYIFKITGGNDKQGFPMMQGVLTNNRVRLLFSKGMKCYRARRTGERKRKSVRGCIVGLDLAVINLVLARKGDNDIPGLTDGQVPRRLGPKRANKIRKMFNLSKDDDVRKYVARRQLEGKKKQKAPKIQRLITSSRLQRKRRIRREKQHQALRSVTARREYNDLVSRLSATKAATKAAVSAPVSATAPTNRTSPQ